MAAAAAMAAVADTEAVHGEHGHEQYAEYHPVAVGLKELLQPDLLLIERRYRATLSGTPRRKSV